MWVRKQHDVSQLCMCPIPRTYRLDTTQSVPWPYWLALRVYTKAPRFTTAAMLYSPSSTSSSSNSLLLLGVPVLVPLHILLQTAERECVSWRR